jgi:hypothetical protein
LLLSFVQPVIAQNDLTSLPEHLGQIGGTVEAVAMEGQYAYIGVGPRMIVLQLGQPSGPTWLAETAALPAIVKDINVVGNVAYVSAGEAGMYLYNVTDPAIPRLMGYYNTPGTVYAVTTVGAYAYVADGEAGMGVYDISDPAHSTLLSYFETENLAHDIAIREVEDKIYAFIADTPEWGQGGAVYAVDVTDPGILLPLDRYDSPGEARGLVLDDDDLYLADGDNLAVLDISDPTDIGLTQAISTTGWIQDVVLGPIMDGRRYAYLSAWREGLQVVEIATPTTSAVVGALDTPGNATDLALRGNHVWLADHMGLRVIDVSDPTTPTYPGGPKLTSSTAAVGEASAVRLEGGYAYVAEAPRFDFDTGQEIGGGLRIFDVSNPEIPAESGFFETSNAARNVTLREPLAYLATESALRVLDVSNPQAIQPRSQVSANATDVAVQDDYAYVTEAPGSLLVVDIADPDNLSTLVTFTLAGPGWGVDVDGNYAYVAAGNGGLQAIDLSDPLSPQAVDTIDLGAWANDVAVRDGFAYIAALSGGLKVVQITRPDALELVATLDLAGDAQRLSLQGEYLYIAADNGGMQVVDISLPTQPVADGDLDVGGAALSVDGMGDLAAVVTIDTLDMINVRLPGIIQSIPLSMTGRTHNLVLEGDYAFITAREEGLRVIDRRNPEAPQQIATFDLEGDSKGLAKDGDYVYVANGELAVLQITNPFYPILVAELEIDGNSQALAIRGDYAYVASIPVGLGPDAGGGIHIIDISDPANPNELAYYDTWWAERVTLAEQDGRLYAHVAAGSNGLRILDVTDLEEVQEVGFQELGWAYDVAEADQVAYVAQGAGLSILDLTDPSSPAPIASHATPGLATGVVLKAGYAYVADADDGLSIVDISEPSRPIMAATYDTAGLAQAITLDGNVAYVTDEGGGLVILKPMPHRLRFPLLLRNS